MKTKIVNIILFFVVLISVIVLISVKGNPINFRSFVVESGSMSPTYPVGSIVFTLPMSTYKKGDPVSFTLAGQTVTHRIYAVNEVNGKVRFTTKGDANKAADENSIEKENIIGKVVLSIPYLGYYVNFLRTLPGFLLFVILPLFIFVVLELRSLKNEFGKEIDRRANEKAKQNEN
jgi:signal peptidase